MARPYRQIDSWHWNECDGCDECRAAEARWEAEMDRLHLAEFGTPTP
ncbi:Uncharacterised protein [Mycobacteroides abscessus subsp. abscessus]|nr:Uncharacterised protein [Mycobacteroides abscessus subsp. abscessus]